MEPVDLLINLLLEGQETMLDASSSENIISLTSASRNEKPNTYGASNIRRKPKLFIKNFKIMTHLKTTFSDNSNGETAWHVER